MTELQFNTFKMWKSFDRKIIEFEKQIDNIDNQCDGDSRQVGYNIKNVQSMKKDLKEVLIKYKELSKKEKSNV